MPSAEAEPADADAADADAADADAADAGTADANPAGCGLAHAAVNPVRQTAASGRPVRKIRTPPWTRRTLPQVPRVSQPQLGRYRGRGVTRTPDHGVLGERGEQPPVRGEHLAARVGHDRVSPGHAVMTLVRASGQPGSQAARGGGTACTHPVR